MKAKIVITNAACGHTAYIFEDEVLSEVHPFSDEEETGSIYVAVVDNIVENLKAAFLRIETGEVLYYSLEENEGRHIFIKHGNKSKVRKGDWLLVQITKAAKGSKKAQATADISLKGRYAVINRSGRVGVSKRITEDEKREELKELYERLKNKYSSELTDDFGIIFRSAAVSAKNEDDIEEDTIKTLRKLNGIIERAENSSAGCCIYKSQIDIAAYIMDIKAKSLYDKITVITDIGEVYEDIYSAGFISETDASDDTYKEAELIFHDEKYQSPGALFNIDRTLSIMFGRKIYLKSGGYLVVDLTEALTVIDVNTGKDIKGSSLPEHILKTNNEAAELIARLLRIRNLSGIIIIDFINMRDELSEEKVIGELKKHISRDHRKCFFVDMTELGLAELTRQRIGTGYILENLLTNINNK